MKKPPGTATNAHIPPPPPPQQIQQQQQQQQQLQQQQHQPQGSNTAASAGQPHDSNTIPMASPRSHHQQHHHHHRPMHAVKSTYHHHHHNPAHHKPQPTLTALMSKKKERRNLLLFFTVYTLFLLPVFVSLVRQIKWMTQGGPGVLGPSVDAFMKSWKESMTSSRKQNTDRQQQHHQQDGQTFHISSSPDILFIGPETEGQHFFAATSIWLATLLILYASLRVAGRFTSLKVHDKSAAKHKDDLLHLMYFGIAMSAIAGIAARIDRRIVNAETQLTFIPLVLCYTAMFTFMFELVKDRNITLSIALFENPLGLCVVAVAGLLVGALLFSLFVSAWKISISFFQMYVGVFAVIIGLYLIMLCVNKLPHVAGKTFLHLHHWYWPIPLCHACVFNTDAAMLAQAIFLSIHIHGVACFGVEPLFYETERRARHPSDFDWVLRPNKERGETQGGSTTSDRSTEFDSSDDLGDDGDDGVEELVIEALEEGEGETLRRSGLREGESDVKHLYDNYNYYANSSDPQPINNETGLGDASFVVPDFTNFNTAATMAAAAKAIGFGSDEAGALKKSASNDNLPQHVLNNSSSTRSSPGSGTPKNIGIGASAAGNTTDRAANAFDPFVQEHSRANNQWFSRLREQRQQQQHGASISSSQREVNAPQDDEDDGNDDNDDEDDERQALVRSYDA